MYGHFCTQGLKNGYSAAASGSAGYLASYGACLVYKAAVGSGERCRAAQVGDEAMQFDIL